MDIHVKLLKHQMELMRSTEDMVYLQCGRGAGKSYIASLMAVLAMLQGKRVICLGPSYRQVTEVLFTECLNRLYESSHEDLLQGRHNIFRLLRERG